MSLYFVWISIGCKPHHGCAMDGRWQWWCKAIQSSTFRRDEWGERTVTTITRTQYTSIKPLQM